MTRNYFSADELEQFMSAYLKKYPDAIERMQRVMNDPFADNDELITRNHREMLEIARTLQFYKEHEGKHESAFYHLIREFTRKVENMPTK